MSLQLIRGAAIYSCGAFLRTRAVLRTVGARVRFLPPAASADPGRQVMMSNSSITVSALVAASRTGPTGPTGPGPVSGLESVSSEGFKKAPGA